MKVIFAILLWRAPVKQAPLQTITKTLHGTNVYISTQYAADVTQAVHSTTLLTDSVVMKTTWNTTSFSLCTEHTQVRHSQCHSLQHLPGSRNASRDKSRECTETLIPVLRQGCQEQDTHLSGLKGITTSFSHLTGLVWIKVMEWSEDWDCTKSQPLGLAYVISSLHSTEISLGTCRAVILHTEITTALQNRQKAACQK